MTCGGCQCTLRQRSHSQAQANQQAACTWRGSAAWSSECSRSRVRLQRPEECGRGKQVICHPQTRRTAPAPSVAACAASRTRTAEPVVRSARAPGVQLGMEHGSGNTFKGSGPSSASAALTEVLTAAALTALLAPPPALADPAGNAVAYDNAAGSESLKTVFGVGYVVLVGIFAVRLLRRRAARAKSERVSGKPDGAEAPPPQLEQQPQGSATPWGAFYGAAQAAALCAVLWTLTTSLGGYFDARPLPANYTASNITVAVKTAVEGLAYLLTFIFGANAVGLSALAVQLLLFPESADQVPAIPKAADPAALPKIKLTDNLYDIRAAFEEVQRQASKSSGSGKGNSSDGNGS